MVYGAHTATIPPANHEMQKRIILSIGIALTLALAVTACGRPIDTPTTTGLTGPTAPPAKPVEPTLSVGSTASAAPTANTVETADHSSQFSQRLSQFKDAEFKVTYEATLPENVLNTEGRAQKIDTITWFQNGRDHFRFDIKFQGGRLATTIIHNGPSVFVCTNIQMKCLNASSDFPGFQQIIAIFNAGLLQQVKNTEGDVQINSTGQRTILGKETDCFDINTSNAEGSACFSVGDNILLEMEFEDKDIGRGMLKATDYATEISDDVLEPLYPVLELPTGPLVPEGADGDAGDDADPFSPRQ